MKFLGRDVAPRASKNPSRKRPSDGFLEIDEDANPEEHFQGSSFNQKVQFIDDLNMLDTSMTQLRHDISEKHNPRRIYLTTQMRSKNELHMV